jgi:hypothetical protein
MENREVITMICGQALELRIKYLCGGQTGCKITLILRLAFLLLPNALQEIFTQSNKPFWFNDCGKLAIQSTQSKDLAKKRSRYISPVIAMEQTQLCQHKSL